MGPEPGLNHARSPSSASPTPKPTRATRRCWSVSPASARADRLSSAAPDPLPLPKSWRKLELAQAAARRQEAVAAVSARSSRWASDMPEAIELLTGAARPILDRWFESDVLKATLATDAIIGAFRPDLCARQRLRAVAPRDGRSGGRTRRVGLRPRAAWAASSDVARQSVRRTGRRHPPRGAGHAHSNVASGRCTGVHCRRRHSDRGGGRRLERRSALDLRAVSRSPDELPRSSAGRGRSGSTTPRPRPRSIWRWPSRRSSLALPTRRSGVGSAPSRHDAHRPDARLPRAGLRRREVRRSRAGSRFWK